MAPNNNWVESSEGEREGREREIRVGRVEEGRKVVGRDEEERGQRGTGEEKRECGRGYTRGGIRREGRSAIFVDTGRAEVSFTYRETLIKEMAAPLASVIIDGRRRHRRRKRMG